MPRWLVTSQRRLRARGVRHPRAARRSLPGRRHRPRARRRGHLPRARGQPAQPERHLLRAREPRRHDPRAADACSATIACGRSTTTARRCSPRCGSVAPAGARVDPTRRRAHARRLQLRLLRARLPRSPDGRRAGRGPRPRRRRPRRVDAHHPRAASASTSSTAASTTHFLDPVVFRRDSTLGVPGLIGRGAGRATSPSPTRSATASPTTRRCTPTCPTSSATTWARSRSSPTSTTYLLWDQDQRAHVLDRLDELVVKPVAESGGYGMLIGPSRVRRGARGHAASASRPTRATTSPRRSCRCRGTPRSSTTTSRAATSTCARSCCAASERRGDPRWPHPRRAAQGLARRELVARAAARRTPGCWLRRRTAD